VKILCWYYVIFFTVNFRIVWLYFVHHSVSCWGELHVTYTVAEERALMNMVSGLHTLTPWNWALLEKPPVVQLINNFPTFYGTWRFITVFTSPSLVPILNQINPFHTTQFSLSKIHFNIIHSPTSWSSYWSLSGFPTNILYACLFPVNATCPAHLVFLDLIVLIILGKDYKLRSSSLCSFLKPAVISVFGPNFLFSTLFINTLRLCFSFNVGDQVSHPYRTTGKIIVL
jgi:hypothetical protein